MDRLETRMDRLEEKVDGVARDLYIYKHQNSRVQEIQHTEYIYKYLSDHLHTHTIRISNMRLLRRQNGEPLTDFDGCITIRSTGNAYKQADITLIIESKHSLNKVRMEQKLSQMNELRDILKMYADHPYNRAKMTTNDADILTLPTNIHLCFASDDLKHELKILLEHIYNGDLTAPLYYKYTLNELVADDFYIQLQLDRFISPETKAELRQLVDTDNSDETIFANIQRIRANCDRNVYKTGSKYLKKYLAPYEKVAPLYESAKHTIGILRFGKFSMPHIISSENESAWAASAGGKKHRVEFY
jgi:hypothetical protein